MATIIEVSSDQAVSERHCASRKHVWTSMRVGAVLVVEAETRREMDAIKSSAYHFARKHGARIRAHELPTDGATVKCQFRRMS